MSSVGGDNPEPEPQQGDKLGASNLTDLLIRDIEPINGRRIIIPFLSYKDCLHLSECASQLNTFRFAVVCLTLKKPVGFDDLEAPFRARVEEGILRRLDDRPKMVYRVSTEDASAVVLMERVVDLRPPAALNLLVLQLWDIDNADAMLKMMHVFRNGYTHFLTELILVDRVHHGWKAWSAACRSA